MPDELNRPGGSRAADDPARPRLPQAKRASAIRVRRHEQRAKREAAHEHRVFRPVPVKELERESQHQARWEAARERAVKRRGWVGWWRGWWLENQTPSS